MPFHEISDETIERLWALHGPKTDDDRLVCGCCQEFWPCPIVRWLEDRPSRWIDRNRGAAEYERFANRVVVPGLRSL